MAVAPTGAIYKALKFDNVSSRTYGVYITGEAVYNAPKRDVEMITIPGRSGSFALDNGRFENIEVSYPAGIFADTEADFRQAISDFRNFLCSRKGYVRLQDEYNPDEYRMAVYKSGLDVDPALLRAGEFTITFDCKPQRWLTSGETKTPVSSGSTVTNPTLFDASPLIECKGYGTISLGGNQITVLSVPIGNILLSNDSIFRITNAEDTAYHDPAEIGRVVLDVSNLNTGDAIQIAASTVTYNISNYTWAFTSISIDNEVGENWATTYAITSSSSAYFKTTIPPLTFNKGTADVKTKEYLMQYSLDGGSVTFGSLVTIKVLYDGNQTVKLYASTYENSTDIFELVGCVGQINGYSTVVANETFHIDLDIGEAYFIKNNAYTSANYAVSIPAKLPTLKAGANTITYSNTITNFKITPRWWKV